MAAAAAIAFQCSIWNKQCLVMDAFERKNSASDASVLSVSHITYKLYSDTGWTSSVSWYFFCSMICGKSKSSLGNVLGPLLEGNMPSSLSNYKFLLAGTVNESMTNVLSKPNYLFQDHSNNAGPTHAFLCHKDKSFPQYVCSCRPRHRTLLMLWMLSALWILACCTPQLNNKNSFQQAFQESILLGSMQENKGRSGNSKLVKYFPHLWDACFQWMDLLGILSLPTTTKSTLILHYCCCRATSLLWDHFMPVWFCVVWKAYCAMSSYL